MADNTKQDAPSQVRTRDYQHDDRPATDGQPVRPIDKALLGGPPQRVGRFDYHYASDTWTWSDTVALMHGYNPGEVEPTTDLVLNHKHPDDLAKVKGLLQQSQAPFSSRHRLRTTSGEVRSVVVVGDAVTDEDGRIVGTRGFYVDITDDENADLQQNLGNELDTIIPNRAVIEQAKGMLMALYAVNDDAAFAILRWRSQQLNIKLSEIAASLVADVSGMLQVDPSNRAPVDRYLMSRPPA
jgi:PAS domain S-box-containing protein